MSESVELEFAGDFVKFDSIGCELAKVADSFATVLESARLPAFPKFGELALVLECTRLPVE